MLRARSHKGSWPGPQQDCTSALRRSGLTAWPDAAKQPASTHSVARQAGRQVGRLAGTSGSGKEELRARTATKSTWAKRALFHASSL